MLRGKNLSPPTYLYIYITIYVYIDVGGLNSISVLKCRFVDSEIVTTFAAPQENPGLSPSQRHHFLI